MFSKELEVTISQAYQEAREKRHEFLTVEHLLLALLDNASALGILSACGADLVKLGVEIRQVLEETVPVLSDDDSRDTQPTIGFQRVLQRALYHVQSAGKLEVTGSNALVAIFSEKDSYATYLLSKHDVTRLDVVNFISHGISKVDPDGTESDADTLTADADEAGEPRASALDQFTTNLNDRARQDLIDPLFDSLVELGGVACQHLLRNSGALFPRLPDQCDALRLVVLDGSFQAVDGVHLDLADPVS